jgi:hypothetical protein
MQKTCDAKTANPRSFPVSASLDLFQVFPHPFAVESLVVVLPASGAPDVPSTEKPLTGLDRHRFKSCLPDGSDVCGNVDEVRSIPCENSVGGRAASARSRSLKGYRKTVNRRLPGELEAFPFCDVIAISAAKASALRVSRFPSQLAAG